MTVWKIQAAIAQPKVAELLARHGWRSDGQPVERPDTLDLLAADLEVERHVLATIDQGPYGVDGVVVARKLRCYQQRAVSLGGAADVPDVWPDDTIAVAQALAEVVKLLKWCAKHPTAAGGVTEVAPVGTEERRVATPSPGAALPAGAVYSRPMHKKEIAAELRVSVKTLSKRQETKGTFCIGTAAQNAPKQAFRFIVIVQVIS